MPRNAPRTFMAWSLAQHVIASVGLDDLLGVGRLLLPQLLSQEAEYDRIPGLEVRGRFVPIDEVFVRLLLTWMIWEAAT